MKKIPGNRQPRVAYSPEDGAFVASVEILGVEVSERGLTAEAALEVLQRRWSNVAGLLNALDRSI